MALRLPRHLRITSVVRGFPALKGSPASIPVTADGMTWTLNACGTSGNSSYMHQIQRHAHNHAVVGGLHTDQANSTGMSFVSNSAVGQISSSSSAISLRKAFHTSSTVTQENAAATKETQTVEVNQPPSSTEEQKLKISDRCVERLEAIAAKEKYRDLVEQGEFKLRVGVRAGGCDGFEYFLDLDKEPVTEDDIVFQRGIAKIVVDDKALEKIEGSTIDFTEDLIGSKFAVVDNPNAETSCGCGTSFAPKEEEGFKI